MKKTSITVLLLVLCFLPVVFALAAETGIADTSEGPDWRTIANVAATAVSGLVAVIFLGIRGDIKKLFEGHDDHETRLARIEGAHKANHDQELS